MSRFLLFAGILVFVWSFSQKALAQSNQTVANGAETAPANFPNTGCVYQWVNNNPRIGLPASGAGNIPPFTAINNGTVPVVATITATAVPNDFAYLSNQGTGLVSVVSTATNTFVTTILTGINPLGVVVSPDNSKVYVADSTTNQVSAISTATNTIIGVIPVGKEPVNLTISPDGKFVYVTNNGANTISVISTGPVKPV
jgi:YVTN family beta-propeller protein